MQLIDVVRKYGGYLEVNAFLKLSRTEYYIGKNYSYDRTAEALAVIRTLTPRRLDANSKEYTWFNYSNAKFVRAERDQKVKFKKHVENLVKNANLDLYKEMHDFYEGLYTSNSHQYRVTNPKGKLAFYVFSKDFTLEYDEVIIDMDELPINISNKYKVYVLNASILWVHWDGKTLELQVHPYVPSPLGEQDVKVTLVPYDVVGGRVYLLLNGAFIYNMLMNEASTEPERIPNV